MEPTANQTGEVIATGTWQKIALAGECAIECNEAFQDAIMADQATVPQNGHWHAAFHKDKTDNRSSWTVPAGGCIWVNAEVGAVFVITAAEPVV